MNIGQLATNFVNLKHGKCHNASSSSGNYQLHQTRIARIDDLRKPSIISFDWGRYYTRTTANHMSAILTAYGRKYGIYKGLSYASHRDRGIHQFWMTLEGIVYENPHTLTGPVVATLNCETLSPTKNRALANSPWVLYELHA